MYAVDCKKRKKTYLKLSCSSLRFINVFIFPSIYPWNSIWSPSLESTASSTLDRSYWCRPHVPLASSEQPNFLSIYATVMTPLISNSPAATEAHLWCMQWQRLISSVRAAESLSGPAKCVLCLLSMAECVVNYARDSTAEVGSKLIIRCTLILDTTPSYWTIYLLIHLFYFILNIFYFYSSLFLFYFIDTFWHKTSY